MSDFISWHINAWQDYLYWQKHDKKVMLKINALIKEISREPFLGTGKPEPLKYALEGYWSRRITLEHRLVYKIRDNDILILQCRYHYQDVKGRLIKSPTHPDTIVGDPEDLVHMDWSNEWNEDL